MNAKISDKTTLGELKEMLDEGKLGLEVVRYRRLGSQRCWTAKAASNLAEHPERVGEATASTPWEAIEMAIRAISKVRRGEGI